MEMFWDAGRKNLFVFFDCCIIEICPCKILIRTKTRENTYYGISQLSFKSRKITKQSPKYPQPNHGLIPQHLT